MEILPRFFIENTYGVLTNSDIESLYYTTMNSQNQSLVSPSSSNHYYKKSIDSLSNNEIDCTVHIEVPNTMKVSIYLMLMYDFNALLYSKIKRYLYGSNKSILLSWATILEWHGPWWTNVTIVPKISSSSMTAALLWSISDIIFVRARRTSFSSRKQTRFSFVTIKKKREARQIRSISSWCSIRSKLVAYAKIHSIMYDFIIKFQILGKCKNGTFKCSDNTCINESLVCNGVKNCKFLDDESNCRELILTKARKEDSKLDWLHVYLFAMKSVTCFHN